MGGCGRAGLPLGITLAHEGLPTVLVDINQSAVDLVNQGLVPFAENGAAEMLEDTVGTTLRATTDAKAVADVEFVIIVIGTPVDEHLNPDPQAVTRAIEAFADHLRDGQCLILRSTLYPGVTELVRQLIDRLGLQIDVAFCPERIAEGKAMTELYELPQIVAARTDAAAARAEGLFRHLTDKIIFLNPEEAELAKLFTNTWRYIRFAIANQLFMIANDHGLDYERIRSAMRDDYPRAADLPAAGFAAGPCLFKDTMQLAAFNNNGFTLGHSAMMVNEGLPLYVVARMEERFGKLTDKTVGILGMAFKSESDDRRSSLSYKLKRILGFRAAQVLTTDPHVTNDPHLFALDDVLEQSDLIVIGTPHEAYRSLKTSLPVIDVWNVTGNGVLI
ncbi:MAG: nucleotide sugar dehydrogenase [Actinobacteria bacterium]|nr:nucleotide sugar dehydrogenase [Actinomycetota bacterium]